MLWNDCDTAVRTHEGSGRRVWELKDCPNCERDWRMKEAQRYADQWEKSA
jgi:hypothetical protein